MANERFRTQYSPYELRLLSITRIESYTPTNFLPMMIINKKELHSINQTLHGSPVGM